jgi:ATP-binding cassette subfamily F protein 3
LWLVSNGTVKPYEEDLEAYRTMLLTTSKPVSKNTKPKEAPKPKRANREDILALRSETRTAEARVTKINDMRDKLAKKLADPALYEKDKVGELEVWNKKYAEVMDALERAEAIWMTSLEKLEKASA